MPNESHSNHGGGVKEMLTLEERKTIERFCHHSTMSISSIGKVLGRGKNTVIVEVRRAGGRWTYNAEKAHAEAQKRMADKYDRLRRNAPPTKAPYQALKERVENLEMQVEILTDAISRMSNL